MEMRPEWIAAGEPFVVYGVLGTALGSGILLFLESLLFLERAPLKTKRKSVVGWIGIVLLVLGCITAIEGVLAMHGIVPD